ncbi:unnamed protein product [Clavelina lepadiformis]|uniref:F5/8 type C domain-containing protein n=1 Tax=Clavelina lepadiformis TaxID=159417 RepID=A0ABP0F7C9_CLALP
MRFLLTVGVKVRRNDDQELQELKMEVMQLRLQQMKGKFCTVGLEDGRVKNHQIAAVSYWGNGFEPHQARLNAVKQASSYGAWASKYLHVGQWIRVDLQYPNYVTGVVTQGRPLESQQWVTSYKIAYGNTTSALQVQYSNATAKML